MAITLLGLEPIYALSFSVYLHVGTGLAALVYFWRDVARIIMRGSEDDRRLFWFLATATFVSGVVGYATKATKEKGGKVVVKVIETIETFIRKINQ